MKVSIKSRKGEGLLLLTILAVVSGVISLITGLIKLTIVIIEAKNKQKK